MAENDNSTFIGIGVSPGIALAPAVVYRPSTIDPPIFDIPVGDEEKEWDRLLVAKDITRRQLKELRDSFGLESANGEAGIIDAHLLVLDDELIVEDTRREIFEIHHNCEQAVRDVANKYIAKFNSFNDALFAERADDIADVSRRLLRVLMGVANDLGKAWNEPCIIVAENLTPSETLLLPRNVVRGLVLDRGSLTSHAALLIRAVGIPAVFGLGNFSSSVTAGAMIGLDGDRGEIFVNPSSDSVSNLLGKAAVREQIYAGFRACCHEPATSFDGQSIECLANIETPADVTLLEMNGAEGVGLLRTEYLWLAEGRPVDEDKQAQAYTEIAKSVNGPVVIRAFDLGGDKFLCGAGLSEREANPFLGKRSIRFLLENESVFKVQVRAVLKAELAANRRISLLIPMVSDVPEIVRTRKIIGECIDELRERTGETCPFPKLGIMVEVPATALIASHFAQYVDFFSIGTNDLTQYTMAADRINESVAYLYQPAHPAVLKLIAMTVEAARKNNIEVCVCGEMTSNPLHAVILLGLGVGIFSMSPAAIPVIKALIRTMPISETRKVASAALESATMAQVRHLSRDLVAKFAPEILKLC